MPGKNAHEEHLMNEMLGYVYVKTESVAEAAKVLEADLDSSVQLARRNVPKRVRQLLTINYQPEELRQGALARRPRHQGRLRGRRHLHAHRPGVLPEGRLQGRREIHGDARHRPDKAGKKPKEQLLIWCRTRAQDERQRVPAAHARAPRVVLPEAVSTGRTCGRHVPAAGSRAAVAATNHVAGVPAGFGRERAEQGCRLHRICAARPRGGSPGEAQAVLEKGFAKNASAKRATRQEQAPAGVGEEAGGAAQAALPKTDAEAAAPNGDKDIAVGVAYLGYQQYDKAVAAFRARHRQAGRPERGGCASAAGYRRARRRTQGGGA